jgi:hypothetical protein
MEESIYTRFYHESSKLSLGYLLAITFDIHNMLCFMGEQGDKDPLNLLGLNKLVFIMNLLN